MGVLGEHDVPPATRRVRRRPHESVLELFTDALGPPARGAVEPQLHRPGPRALGVLDVYPEVLPAPAVDHGDVLPRNHVVLRERPPQNLTSLVGSALQLRDPRVVPSHQPPEQRVERGGTLVHPLEYLLAASRGRAPADHPALGDPRQPESRAPVNRLGVLFDDVRVAESRPAVSHHHGDHIVPPHGQHVE